MNSSVYKHGHLGGETTSGKFLQQTPVENVLISDVSLFQGSFIYNPILSGTLDSVLIRGVLTSGVSLWRDSTVVQSIL